MDESALPVITSSDVIYSDDSSLFRTKHLFLAFLQERFNVKNENDYTLEELADGVTNKLYKCIILVSGLIVLLRLYGKGTENFIDRQAEVKIIKFLVEMGDFPAFFGVFPGGMAYGYIEGKALSTSQMSLPEVWTQIATRLAFWHSNIHPPISKETAGSFIFDFIKNCLKTAKSSKKTPKSLDINSILTTDLLKEIKTFLEEARRIIEQKPLDFPIAFCHNDLLAGNIVLSIDNTKISFIDFEYAHYNYAAYDICNNWVEYAGMGDTCNYDESFPSISLQKSWLTVYLTNTNAIDYKFKINDELVEEWRSKILFFLPLTHLFWASWALVQANNSSIDFDYVGWAWKRIEQFKKTSFLVLI